MKKLTAWLLAALLLTGCGTKPAPEAPIQPTEKPAEATPAPETTAVFDADGSVIFEKDGVKVTTAGLDEDPTDGNGHPIIWVDIENSADGDAYLGVANGSVNGWESDILLIDFYEENGEYFGADYEFQLTIPANSSGKYALSYYKNGVPGVNMDELGEMEFSFSLAEDEFSWPDYYSEPVVIRTGEIAAADITTLGTVVLEDDTVTLVLGEQDYNEWFGPEIYVYAVNKTDRYMRLLAETAQADGAESDYILFGMDIAPGKQSAAPMSFEGGIKGLNGFEELTLGFALYQAETKDGLDSAKSVSLAPVSMTYPPQNWGVYENGGLHLDVQPRCNELVTVKTPENDENGVLFSVSETASLEAAGYEGAGWLFSIGRVDSERLHELLCGDMSGAMIFAKDDEGYLVYYYPTDVRYERATTEELFRDEEQWSMLSSWAFDMSNSFCEKNGLESASFGNGIVEISIARAAWMDGAGATLGTTEYGPLEIRGVDGTPYAEAALQCSFWDADLSETPDGEYVVLAFPEEELRLDFFLAEEPYVRVVQGEEEMLYQASWYEEEVDLAKTMQSWYYALAENAGLKAAE